MSLLTRAMELKRERGTLIQANRDLLEKCEAEKRDRTAEENQEYDRRWAEIEKMGGRIAEMERTAEAEAGLEPAEPRGGKPAAGEDRGKKPTESPEERTGRIVREVRTQTEAEYQDRAEIRAVSKWLRSGVQELSQAELRALEVTNSASGGYLQPPQEFVAKLIQAVDNTVFVRGKATKYTIPQAESLGAPSLANDPADPTWVGELSIGSEDSTMSFGKRELRPHPMAQFIKVSNTLLRKSALGAEGIVRERLAYKNSVVQENAFLNGTGAAQPLGVFTASTNGVSTGRDVSTGNTSTSIGADGLIEAKYTLKSQYWPRASWTFHRDAVKQIAKLKDGEGQYLWQPGLQAGQPDRVLGFAMDVSEYAPNTFTTGLYVGMLCDWSFYWIADALDMQVQRLVELYAATNQTGFITRSETDGLPVLEEAFVRVKLA